MVTKADLELNAKFTCPARMADPKAVHETKKDYWLRRGPDDQCSYCLSMHPQQFLDWCSRCCEPDSHVRIETTEKAGRWNIVRRGIQHAGQGATRCYQFHLPKEGSSEWERVSWNKSIGDAIEISVSRAPRPARR